MFKKTSTHTQKDLFSSPDGLLAGRSLAMWLEESAWQNVFRKQVTMRLDESLFSCLYSSGQGRPASSIRVLVAMMVLKEARGCSDAELYEDVRFNMAVRRALCLDNLSDPVPTESTYYLLRKHIVDYEAETGVNLFEKAFAQITREQAVEFDIRGNRVRMDSKLLGSNIAWLTRYELVHETLRLFLDTFADAELAGLLSGVELDLALSVKTEKGSGFTYRSQKDAINSRMAEAGALIYKLLELCPAGCGSPRRIKARVVLARVFGDQYSVEESSREVSPLPKEQIRANSVQSPHDTDCAYRKKGDTQVKGYSVNVTETCDKKEDRESSGGEGGKGGGEANPLNLITDVKVEKATFGDNAFLEPSVQSSNQLLAGSPEKVHADGAYHSVENQAYCADGGMELILSGFSGDQARYELYTDPSVRELIVIDKLAGKILLAKEYVSRKDGKVQWKIKTTDKKGQDSLRYFTEKEIQASLLRQKLRLIPTSEINVRNNVEASIFQLGYHFHHNKSKYRGLAKQKIWANCRALWINFRRIHLFLEQKLNNADLLLQNPLSRLIIRLFYTRRLAI